MPHLHVSSVEVRPGAQVQLSCDPGFYLLGEPILQCQNKGEWSHPLPSCERKAQTHSDPRFHAVVVVVAIILIVFTNVDVDAKFSFLGHILPLVCL